MQFRTRTANGGPGNWPVARKHAQQHQSLLVGRSGGFRQLLVAQKFRRRDSAQDVKAFAGVGKGNGTARLQEVTDSGKELNREFVEEAVGLSPLKQH